MSFSVHQIPLDMCICQIPCSGFNPFLGVLLALVLSFLQPGTHSTNLSDIYWKLSCTDSSFLTIFRFFGSLAPSTILSLVVARQ